jgi:hypothetical protein
MDNNEAHREYERWLDKKEYKYWEVCLEGMEHECVNRDEGKGYYWHPYGWFRSV